MPFKIYENITKSVGDSRTYRALELDNEMKVLLISDPQTDKSAAAIDVQIGSMSEPRELPGLAHFCEHMLFLGTKKYPSENDYTKFLHEHSGSSNAFTGLDNTCFFFDVAPDSLKDALDRFAQFFLCPLFTESASDREVNAVDSEQQKNIQSDSWRLVQLERSTCNPLHDYSKFGTGNVDTLSKDPKSKGINVRDELLKFHEKFYSSNLMALGVLGKESLDDLMNIVIPLFSEVVNKNVELPFWKEHPFSSEYLKLQGYVAPVKDIRSLNVTFPIPDLSHEYRCNPGHYISHLIGREGCGSLLSELKSRGWVNTLAAGVKPGARGFAFFTIDVSLTEEGLEHTNDIVTLIFQYLALLKNKGPIEWIFEECKNLNAITFRFKDCEKPQSYVCHLAGKMFLYPMEDVLCGSYLLHEFKPDLINDLLGMLNADSIRVAVLGKKFEDVCSKTEKWYGTKYSLDSIGEDMLQLWKSAAVHPSLFLPAPNDLIPTRFNLVPADPNNTKYPTLLKNTKMCRLWFKQDDTFLLPKAALNFEIESPMAYVDPLHYNMTHLFVLLVKDSLNEYAYAAELAGLAYVLSNTKLGIFLGIRGYNDKQHVLLQKIIDRLTTIKIDKKRFEIMKNELRRCLSNFGAEQPHRQAIYFASMLLAEKTWTNEELLNCIDEITVESVQQLIPRLFSRVHIEALMYGNMNKQTALDLMELIESSLSANMDSKFLMPSQLAREREVQLSDGCHYVYEVTNEIHGCSAIETYYQCGVQETRTNMLLELLTELINEPCYTVLRTQEQLGYIVFSGPRRSSSAQGLRVIVQSDKPPSFVDGRIESFIQYFEKHMEDMTENEFQNHVESLALLRLEKPKKMVNLIVKYWLEISSHHYNFDRDEIEVACLRTITKDELVSFFKELIAYDAPKRKKLSVQVLSTKCKIPNETLLPEADCVCLPNEEAALGDGLIPPPPAFRPPVKIENVTSFKNSLCLYSLPPSWIHFPSPFVDVPKKAKL